MINLFFSKPKYNFVGFYQHYDEVPISESIHESNNWINDTIRSTKDIIKISAGYGIYHKLLPILVYIEFSKEKKIRIVDFGGGAGIDFFNLESCLNDYYFDYFVIENKKLCKESAKEFQKYKNLQFISFEIFNEGIDQRFDVCYCNSALQYVKDYKDVLKKFVSFYPEYIIFERLSAGDNPTFFTSQINIGGSIPYCIIKIDDLIEFLSERGYDILYKEKMPLEFDIASICTELPDSQKVRVMNIIFKRKQNESLKIPYTQWPICMETSCCPKCGFNGIKEICLGKDFRVGIPGVYHVVECTKCSLWYQNPRPSYDDIDKLYPPFYSSYLIPSTYRNVSDKFTLGQIFNYIMKSIEYIFEIFIFNKNYENGINLIPVFVDNGTILVIGCATGSRLETLRNIGWKNVYGIELLPEAAKMAQEKGFKVDCGRVEDILESYPNHHFDVIIASMVLEHFQNPFKVVKKIAEKIKPGGQFLCSTVCRDSLDQKIFGCYWAGFNFPRHMVYFRMSDITSILHQSFEDIQIFYHNETVDFVRSASWRDTNKDKVIKIIIHHAGYLIGVIQRITKSASKVSIHCRRM